MASLVAPAAVRRLVLEEVDWPLRLGTTPDGRPYRTLAALVQSAGGPASFVVVDVDDEGAVDLPAVRAAAAVEPSEADAGNGAAPPAVAPVCPPLSIVLPTCRGASVVRCIGSFLQDHDDLEVIVVENRPSGSNVRATVAECFPADDWIRVVDEPQPGLSRARNRGHREAAGEIIAFLDDDVVCEPSWLPAVRAAFAGRGDPHLLTGPILPLSLDAPTQVVFEQFAAFGKGRGPRRSGSTTLPPATRSSPTTSASSDRGRTWRSGRTCSRRSAASTRPSGRGRPRGEERARHLPSHAEARGERDLRSPGDRLARAPGGLAPIASSGVPLRHRAGRDPTKQLVEPAHRRELLRRVLHGVAHLLNPISRKNAGKGEGYPRRLDLLERLGMACGPVAYGRSRARLARRA